MFLLYVHMFADLVRRAVLTWSPRYDVIQMAAIIIIFIISHRPCVN